MISSSATRRANGVMFLHKEPKINFVVVSNVTWKAFNKKYRAPILSLWWFQRWMKDLDTSLAAGPQTTTWMSCLANNNRATKRCFLQLPYNFLTTVAFS